VETPVVTVNGRTVPLADAGPHTTALEWLRGLGLTGCKEGARRGSAAPVRSSWRAPGRTRGRRGPR
jgi:xanthine dehydrogenase small subunit